MLLRQVVFTLAVRSENGSFNWGRSQFIGYNKASKSKE